MATEAISCGSDKAATSATPTAPSISTVQRKRSRRTFRSPRWFLNEESLFWAALGELRLLEQSEVQSTVDAIWSGPERTDLFVSPTAQSVSVISSLLICECPKARRAAQRVLEAWVTANDAHLEPILAQIVDAANEEVRLDCCELLARVRPTLLTRNLYSTDDHISRGLLSFLATDPSDRPLDLLKEWSLKGNTEMALAAITALGYAPAAEPGAVELLVQIVLNAHESVHQEEACDSLGKHFPALATFLSEFVTMHVHEAIGNVEDLICEIQRQDIPQGNRVLILGKTAQELFKGAFAPAAPLAFAAETSL